MSNSVIIASVISIFFVLLSLLLPIINTEFENNDNNLNANYDSLNNDLSQEHSQLTFWKYAFSFIQVFFWSFGTFPFWFDLIVFGSLRIALLLALVDIIWIG